MNCKICNAPCRDEFCDDCAVLGAVHMIGHGVMDLQKQLTSAVEVIKFYADMQSDFCTCYHSRARHFAASTACSITACDCQAFTNKAAEWLKENGYE